MNNGSRHRILAHVVGRDLTEQECEKVSGGDDADGALLTGIRTEISTEFSTPPPDHSCNTPTSCVKTDPYVTPAPPPPTPLPPPPEGPDEGPPDIKEPDPPVPDGGFGDPYDTDPSLQGV